MAQVKYDKFWVDGAKSLNEEAPASGFTGQGALGILSSGPLGMLGGMAAAVVPPAVKAPLTPALSLVGSTLAPAVNLGASATERLIDQAAHVLFPAVRVHNPNLSLSPNPNLWRERLDGFDALSDDKGFICCVSQMLSSRYRVEFIERSAQEPIRRRVLFHLNMSVNLVMHSSADPPPPSCFHCHLKDGEWHGLHCTLHSSRPSRSST